MTSQQDAAPAKAQEGPLHRLRDFFIAESSITIAESGRKTYLYLRLVMVAMVVLITGAVAKEWWMTGSRPDGDMRRCVQTSISAYWYTPAQAIFVAALVAIGISMIVLKGTSEGEDMLLNFAGMLAPVVAMVPTPNPGSCSSRESSLSIPVSESYVRNNVSSLLTVGILALVLTALMLVGSSPTTGSLLARVKGVRPAYRWGLGLAAVVVAGMTTWFQTSPYASAENPTPRGFFAAAHYTAAITMFVFFWIVVGVNYARASQREEPVLRAYRLIFWLMLIAAVVVAVVKVFNHWDYSVITIEAAEILLFAIFWVVQTLDPSKR